MTTEVADPSSSTPIPRKNVFQRIAGVLFAPASTFEEIARKPDIIAPLLVIVIIGYIGTAIIMPRMDWDAVTAQQIDAVKAKNPNMSNEDMERMSRMTAAVGKVFGWVGPLIGIVWYVIVAGVLLLAFRLFGGEGTFGQAFSVTLYSWIPLALNVVVLALVILARGTLVDPTQMATVLKSNPAFLVDMKEQPVLFSLLSSFDIFTIWTIVLLIIGFAALSRSSKAKSAIIVISMWIVSILIKVGFAAIGAARMKA